MPLQKDTSVENSPHVVSNVTTNNKVYNKLKANFANNYQKEQSNTQKPATQVSPNVETKPTVKPPAITQVIDVIRDYDWTYSAKNELKNSEVPYIHIKEFRMLGNSYMSSLMTSALLFPDIAKSATDANSPAANLFSKVQDSFKDNKFGKFMSNVGNANADIVNKLQEKTKAASNWVKTQMESIDKTANAWGGNRQDLIDNYSYLYLRKPTDREYKFPYFETEYISISNNFQDSYEGGNAVARKIFEVTKEYAEEAETLLSSPIALTEPGMLIQRPKFYHFGEEGYEVKSDFYLFNTLNPDSYLKNLDLITKLLIQNTPHRHNRLLVDPVCIYELTVPGRGFYPYTYINALNVTHVGTKRMLRGVKGNQIIVPDAFKVQISFKSLTSDVNNFIIPETGTAGIDVTQRFGLGEIIKNFGSVDSTTKK